MLEYLKGRGCRIGGVTQGERGILWYDESGEVRKLPALAVPPEIVRDTSGAGDVFHGAYVYSYLAHPTQSWEEHFQFAQRAAVHKIQHLGNEAGLPTIDDIKAVEREFGQGAEPLRPARRNVSAMR
jgi:sugar/nucleoside kinase (ribokinase family)